MVKVTKEAALRYHSQGKPGKIEIVPTKPYRTQSDLSLAYSPGVAEPCLEIQKNPEDAYKYTNKGNLVAVISNGTAVLGLGDIGAMSGKPVMEGKSLLFKIYAGVDAFDIEINEKDPEKFISAVKAIAPTFGGINLEDIKAPECFEIEKRLKEELDIPVMHDDQHGTAIISAAGLVNALQVNGKDIAKIKIVVNGAGAAAISCTRLYKALGAKAENILMLDSKGVITADRPNLTEQKKEFFVPRPFTASPQRQKRQEQYGRRAQVAESAPYPEGIVFRIENKPVCGGDRHLPEVGEHDENGYVAVLRSLYADDRADEGDRRIGRRYARKNAVRTGIQRCGSDRGDGVARRAHDRVAEKNKKDTCKKAAFPPLVFLAQERHRAQKYTARYQIEIGCQHK